MRAGMVGSDGFDGWVDSRGRGGFGVVMGPMGGEGGC